MNRFKRSTGEQEDVDFTIEYDKNINDSKLEYVFIIRPEKNYMAVVKTDPHRQKNFDDLEQLEYFNKQALGLKQFAELYGLNRTPLTEMTLYTKPIYVNLPVRLSNNSADNSIEDYYLPQLFTELPPSYGTFDSIKYKLFNMFHSRNNTELESNFTPIPLTMKDERRSWEDSDREQIVSPVETSCSEQNKQMIDGDELDLYQNLIPEKIVDDLYYLGMKVSDFDKITERPIERTNIKANILNLTDLDKVSISENNLRVKFKNQEDMSDMSEDFYEKGDRKNPKKITVEGDTTTLSFGKALVKSVKSKLKSVADNAIKKNSKTSRTTKSTTKSTVNPCSRMTKKKTDKTTITAKTTKNSTSVTTKIKTTKNPTTATKTNTSKNSAIATKTKTSKNATNATKTNTTKNLTIATKTKTTKKITTVPVNMTIKQTTKITSKTTSKQSANVTKSKTTSSTKATTIVYRTKATEVHEIDSKEKEESLSTTVVSRLMKEFNIHDINITNSCNASDFKLKNHCFCNMKKVVSELRDDVKDINKSANFEFDCPSYIRIEPGVVITNKSETEFHRKKRYNRHNLPQTSHSFFGQYIEAYLEEPVVVTNDGSYSDRYRVIY